MAFGAHKGWYTSSAKYAAVAVWSAAHATAAGDLIRQTGTPTVGNERVYVALTGGTTSGADPLTVFTRGNKITDNTVTWQEATGIPALNGDITNTPNWVASRAVSTSASLGHVVKDAAGTHIFIVSTAGTVGATEPTWNTAAVGNTTTDNTTTWTYIGTSFANWAAPHARQQNAFAAGWGDSNTTDSQFYYIGSDHAETQAASIAWTARGSIGAPIDVVCVNVAGSVPPVSADLATTATITTTGSNGIAIGAGHFRVFYGVTFSSGTTGAPGITTNSGTGRKRYEQCVFTFGTGIAPGSGVSEAEGAYTEYHQCKIRAKGAAFTYGAIGRVLWTSSEVIDSTGTIPSTFMQSGRADVTFRGCDLSPLSAKIVYTPASSTIIENIRIEDSKIPASWTLINFANAQTRAQRITISRCHSAAGQFRAEMTDTIDGTQLTATDVTRHGGGIIDGQACSWLLTTQATNVNLGFPFRSLPIGKTNPTTASNVVVTAYGIANQAAAPTNSECWMEVDYLGDSGSPQTTRKSNRVADFLASAANLSADTSDWDDNVSARANTHVYAVGDIIKTASNPGRIFFCTVGGTSAGSEPGGYATAVDGGTVTDNTATFRAGWRFSLAVTLTSPQPQLVGLLYAHFAIAKPSNTVYIDPTVNLS